MNDTNVNNTTQQVQQPAVTPNVQPVAQSEIAGDMGVTKRDVENVVSSWTGIPISKLTEDESAKLLKLEDRIHQRLIDQEEAVVKVSEAVRRGRIGLASGQRPIASFIFLGPSGTGKTELAKTLAEILFGRDDAMIRLDMSEYMEKHEVAKLIGAPPGYVGYEEGGQLTEAVRAKPYSIVLLDEVEKAHPDVFNILLQLLEDGRLTDNKGNTISFKNTIVICTSNIGSALITEKLAEKDAKAVKTPAQYAKDFAELSDVVNVELRKFFRPELLNRYDDIVIFKPLRREDMVGIAKLGIEKTAKLLKEQGYAVQITDRALAKLAREGYDPMYGARPLRRLIQGSVENPIALEIIGKKFIAGDTIRIDFNESTNQFVFTKNNQAFTAQQPVNNPQLGEQQLSGQASLVQPQPAQGAQNMAAGQQTASVQNLPPVVPATTFDPLSVLAADPSQTAQPVDNQPVITPPSTGVAMSLPQDAAQYQNVGAAGAANGAPITGQSVSNMVNEVPIDFYAQVLGLTGEENEIE